MKKLKMKVLTLLPLLAFLASCSLESVTSANASNNSTGSSFQTSSSSSSSEPATATVDTTNYAAVVNALTFEETTELGSATTINAGDEITTAGSYVITGTQNDSVSISATGEVHLYLQDVTWTAKKKVLDVSNTVTKLIITSIGTNTISNSTADKNAVSIDSTGEAVFNGSGSLTITATKSCIKADGTIKLVGGTYRFISTGNAISGSTIIAKGSTIYSESGKDVFHAELDDTVTAFTYSAGYVYLKDVQLTTGGTDKVYGDLVQADTYVYVDGGSLSGTTTGVFVTDTTDNRSTYDLEDDDFRYILQNGTYKKVASDYRGSSTFYALAQSAKGIKAGEIEYDSDGDDEDDGSVSSTAYAVIVTDSAILDFTCTDDAIHGNSGNTLIEGSTLTLSSYDDGVTTDHILNILDSTINITACYEGLEGEKIIIDGSDTDIDIVSEDDGINASTDYETTDLYIEINNGSVHVNATGDGLDSNGYLVVNGGTVFVEGPTDAGNSALDTETGIFFNGGNIMAYGSKVMLEVPSSNSTQMSLVYAPTSSVTAGSTITVNDANDNVLMSETISKAAESFIISTPSFTSGSSYSIKNGSTTLKTISLTSMVTNDGNLGGNNAGGPGGGTNPGGGGGRP